MAEHLEPHSPDLKNFADQDMITGVEPPPNDPKARYYYAPTTVEPKHPLTFPENVHQLQESDMRAAQEWTRGMQDLNVQQAKKYGAIHWKLSYTIGALAALLCGLCILMFAIFAMLGVGIYDKPRPTTAYVLFATSVVASAIVGWGVHAFILNYIHYDNHTIEVPYMPREEWFMPDIRERMRRARNRPADFDNVRR